MTHSLFHEPGQTFLNQLLDLALAEDGTDMTSQAIFPRSSTLRAEIVAKETSLVVGLPFISRVFERMQEQEQTLELLAQDGETVKNGQKIAHLRGPAAVLLKGERVIMNLICHLSGIANATARMVQAVEGTGVRILDTRKTTPGLRYLEKYAVKMGGGYNHRVNLEEMLMLKDNHIDQAGSITAAVQALQKFYASCPPLEIECRTLAHVREAVRLSPQRIMLDNMPPEIAREALKLIPRSIESEISGNITLENVRAVAALGPTYISSGALTHSAPAADFSMRLHQGDVQ